MAKKTRQTAAKRALPSTHNSGLPALTKSESACVERALEALATARQTFEVWVAIGKALKALHLKAEAIGKKKAYDSLRVAHGLGKEVISKSRSSRLLRIINHLSEVEAWREELSEKDRFNWQSPEAVHRHFFGSDKRPAAPNIDKLIEKLAAAMDGRDRPEREQVVERVREALIETDLEEAA
jgi:hypothetical protein